MLKEEVTKLELQLNTRYIFPYITFIFLKIRVGGGVRWRHNDCLARLLLNITGAGRDRAGPATRHDKSAVSTIMSLHSSRGGRKGGLSFPIQEKTRRTDSRHCPTI